MPHRAEDDFATRDGVPTCTACVESEAERIKYEVMASELKQQLA